MMGGGEGGGRGVNLNQYCSLAVLFSAIETGLLKLNDNKIEKSLLQLEDK